MSLKAYQTPKRYTICDTGKLSQLQLFYRQVANSRIMLSIYEVYHEHAFIYISLASTVHSQMMLHCAAVNVKG